MKKISILALCLISRHLYSMENDSLQLSEVSPDNSKKYALCKQEAEECLNLCQGAIAILFEKAKTPEPWSLTIDKLDDKFKAKAKYEYSFVSKEEDILLLANRSRENWSHLPKQPNKVDPVQSRRLVEALKNLHKQKHEHMKLEMAKYLATQARIQEHIQSITVSLAQIENTTAEQTAYNIQTTP